MNRRLALIMTVSFGWYARSWAVPDFEACLSSGPHPICEEVHSTTYTRISCDAPRSFFTYWGRVAWGTLRCVGPITIELNTLGFDEARFPLYVEVVPVRSFIQCPTTGVVVMAAHGVNQHCGGWESSSPIDITSIVPLGSYYWIQVVFFRSALGRYSSPGLDCIRVTSHSVAVESKSWSRIKVLFRE